MIVRIYHDVFDICDRVKELDEGYYPVYDTERHRYEIRHSDGDYIAVVVPYDSLDSRILRHLYITRRDNAEKLVRELDDKNRRREEKSEQRVMDEAGYKARHLLSFAKNVKNSRAELPRYEEI